MISGGEEMSRVREMDGGEEECVCSFGGET